MQKTLQNWTIDEEDIINMTLKEQVSVQNTDHLITIKLHLQYFEIDQASHSRYLLQNLTKIMSCRVNTSQSGVELKQFLEQYFVIKDSKILEILNNNSQLLDEQELKDFFRDSQEAIVNLEIHMLQQDNFPSEQEMPIFPLDFEIYPNFQDLCRLDRDQLKKIENFQIKCGNTFVNFIKPINLISADFTQGLVLNETRIELKPELKNTLYKFYNLQTLERYIEVYFSGINENLYRQLQNAKAKFIKMISTSEDSPTEIHFNEDTKTIKILF